MKTSKTIQTRIATREDFKVGSVLIDSEGNRHSIVQKYIDGIWDTRNSNVIMECEAKFYKVEMAKL